MQENMNRICAFIHQTRPVLHLPQQSPRRIQEITDAAAKQIALEMEAGGKGQPTNTLAAFACTDNAAVTCATSSTARADSLDFSVAR